MNCTTQTDGVHTRATVRGETRPDARGGARAFTLMELLVVLLLTAILLAILVPALGGTRESARSVACRVQQSEIYKLQQLAAGQNGGYWPNDLATPETSAEWNFAADYAVSASSVVAQATYWMGPLLTARVYERGGAALPACPGVQTDPDTPPEDRGILSYYYSLAMTTDPMLWAADQPQRRADPDKYRRNIAISDVQFPSAKVELSEVRDVHASNQRLGDEPVAGGLASNVVFADGHAARKLVQDARPALPLVWEWFPGDDELRALPFSSSEGGAMGTDF